MKRFITKYLLSFMLMLTVAVLVWAFVVYHWFHETVHKSLTPVIAGVQSEFSNPNTLPADNSKDRLKLYFTELEKNNNIVTYSFLNEDKSVNYTEGIRKRDNILWTLNFLYPVTVGDKIIGWIKVWPSPELIAKAFLTEKNIIIVLISFFLSVIVVFAAVSLYMSLRFFIPLSDFKKAVKNISDGTSTEIKFNYEHGIWKDVGDSIRKLNSKVIDVNTTVQMLFSVSKMLTSQVDMSRIFNIIMSIIQKKVPGAMCAIFLPGEDGSLRVVAKCGYSRDFVKSIKIEEGNPVSDAFITGKMIAVKNLHTLDEKFIKIFTDEGVLSQINVPSTDENNFCLGVLSVSSDDGTIFETGISDTISTMGKYLSIALRNVKLYDKVQSLNRRLESEVNITSSELIQTNAKLIKKVRDIKGLYDISLFASVKFNLDDLTKIIVKKILELTGFETVAILVKNLKSGEFVFLENSFDMRKEKLVGYSFSEQKTPLIRELQKEKRPLIFNSLQDIRQECPEFLKVTAMSSVVFVPIELHKDLIGCIVAANKFASGISDGDIKMIEHISVLLSGIMEKIRLYSELEAKVRELTFLQKISSAIETIPTLENILVKIIGITKETFNADLCAVLLYDKNSRKLITQPGAYFTGGEDKVMLAIDEDDPYSMAAKTFREGVAYLSTDATSVSSVSSRSARELGIKSIIIVPLKIDNSVIGVVRVGKHEADAYNEDDKKLIAMMAGQAAIIIENANLYTELASCKIK